jgi:EmrB/QacA subfamily drug resistance transporter
MADDITEPVPKTGSETGPRLDIVVAVPDHTKVPGRSLILAACLMATFVSAIESTIIATAMPSIVSELGGFDLFSWVFTIFLLTQAVSIPIYGRLADMFGRKRVFFGGVGLFLIGPVLCGFAWGMVPLICFRAIQGLGAGAVQPIAATILGDIYTPAERAQVQGLVSSVFGVSAVTGPSLGAFLIAHVSWSSVFWVCVPIGAASVVMIGLFLHETGDTRHRSIDWLGALLMLLTVGSLTVALVQGGQLSRVQLGSMLGICFVSVVLLILHERATREPMLPLELWRNNRVIVVGSLGSFAAGALMTGISAFLPAYVQGAMGLSAMTGGIVLGAMSVSWAAASLIGGRIMVRTSYRLVAVLGAIALVAGCSILIVAPPAAGPAFTALGSFIVGIGMGFCMSVFVVSIQASVPWRQRGAATSSAMFMRFMGQVMGTSGCGAVLNATILRLDPDAVGAIDRMLSPVGRASLPPAQIAHLTEVITRGMHNAWLLAGFFSLLALLFACLMPARLSPRSTMT